MPAVPDSRNAAQKALEARSLDSWMTAFKASATVALLSLGAATYLKTGGISDQAMWLLCVVPIATIMVVAAVLEIARLNHVVASLRELLRDEKNFEALILGVREERADAELRLIRLQIQLAAVQAVRAVVRVVEEDPPRETAVLRSTGRADG